MRSGRAIGYGCAACVVFACACDHDHGSSKQAAGASPAAAPLRPAVVGTAAPPSDCGHAVCTDNLFVDAAPGAACAAGSVCTLKLTLVATGDYHVNDEYPYRFKAEEASGLHFLGTDGAGKNVFSKGAGDWAKIDPKSGAMTVKFTPEARGPATIAGVFKLSVCSGDACQLEQSRVTASVAVN